MADEVEEAKKQIDSIIGGYQAAAGMKPHSVLSPAATAYKVYEGWVLCEVLARLNADEGMAITRHRLPLRTDRRERAVMF
jgi:hypothetical protein